MGDDLSQAFAESGDGATFDDVAVAAAQQAMTPAELLAWWDAQLEAGSIQSDEVAHRQRRFRLAG
jgi:hypothetical protein